MTEQILSTADILALLSKRWMTTIQITKKLGFTDTRRIRGLLKQLEDQGIIESNSTGRNSQWRLHKRDAKTISELKKQAKKDSIESISEKELQKRLVSIGTDLYNTMEQGDFPLIKIPSRSTSNIQFDPTLRHFILGDSFSTRSVGNIKQIRSISQQIWVMRFIKTLLETDKSSTLRDVYYQSFGFDVRFESQSESDSIITDTEAVLRVPRETFKVFPEERSAIFGDLEIEYTSPKKYIGKRVNIQTNPDGFMIGPHVVDAKFIRTGADKMIAVESGGMFTRFVEEDVSNRFKALLVHTAGQAPRSTRRLLRRLGMQYQLPLYIFTDGDPWGVHIAMVIISGSAQAAHIRGLASPDAIWIGVWASDIIDYKLPSFDMTLTDIKRTEELLRDPRYQSAFWQVQLQTFLKIKKKAEQQAFSKYSLDYVVDEYLPKKFGQIKELKRKGVL